jgi:hypothetical protein
MLKRRLAKRGLRAAIRYRRPIVRVATAMARNPDRTRRNARRAAALIEQARSNPRGRKQAKAAVSAASSAAGRARKLGPARAANDRRILHDLRAAATAMTNAMVAAQEPARKRSRIGTLLVGVGMAAAGAYAGFQAYRSATRRQAACSTPTADTVRHSGQSSPGPREPSPSAAQR